MTGSSNPVPRCATGHPLRDIGVQRAVPTTSSKICREGLDVPQGSVVPNGPVGESHRVAITRELYCAARRYMVEHDLPTVRSAVEAMIRAQAEGADDQTTENQAREAKQVANA